jgi:uncharacterized membrane protein
MRTIVLPVHILAAILGLVFGFVALYAAKGARLHRASGRLFVYAMVTMSMLGAAIAAVWGAAPALNVPVGSLTAYLVVTALITVRPGSAESRRVDLGLMLVAVAVTLALCMFGVEALANGGKRDGIPAFPFFMFAAIGLLGGAGDLRVLRSGPLEGASRLRRHLWRMSAALLIAALSFAVQLPKMLPEPVRVPGLLRALPILAVLVTMLYWLWRVRSRRTFRAVVGISVPEAV